MNRRHRAVCLQVNLQKLQWVGRFNRNVLYRRINLFIYRSVVCIIGVGSFYLSKKSVDKRRYEDMKIRQRMRESNSGEYTPSYRFSTSLSK